MSKFKRQPISPPRGPERADDKLISRAFDLMERGLHAQALTILDGLLKKNPRHYAAALNRGVCLSSVGRFDEAAKQFYSVHQTAPENLDVLQLCGESHLAAGYFDMAIKFLKRCIRAKPEEVSNWRNLSIAAGKSGQLTEAVMYATQALSLAPLDATLYVNLGTALLSLNRIDEAEQAYETALAIDPTNLTALGNLATVLDKRGDYLNAIERYDSTYLRMDPNSQEAKELLYRSSFPYLASGQLREGWRRYDYGFFPTHGTSRHPKRKFSVPQWTGEPLREQDRLLIWGEQGLGDEFWFFGILNEVRERCKHIIVECQPRLVSLFQRSFPDVHVRASNLSPMATSDYDLHIPAGSLVGIFRNHIDDFKKFKPYIRPDATRSKNFSVRLQPYAGKKLVGICWRSGKVNAQRIQNYLHLDELSEVLTNPNYAIVNLQYGECEEELLRAEDALGVKIIRWHDVDLKDDQEALAALMSELDVVLSAPTAVAQLAIALGTPLVYFRARNWSFLGQETFPWTDRITCVIPKNTDRSKAFIPEVVDAVERIAVRSK